MLKEMTSGVVSVGQGDYGHVFDAEGNPVDFCIDANLDTGECLVFETLNGKVLVQDREAVRKTIVRPAPLRFVRRDPKGKP
jgi:hypothetical protein